MRMLGQGSINALTAGLIFTVVWLMWRTYQKLSLISLYYFIIERYAELKLAIGEYFYPIDQIGIKFYYLEQKAWVYHNAEEFVYKFWHITPYSHNINQFGQFLLHSAWQEGIITFTVGMFTAIIFFMYRGKKAVIQDKIRGADFVEAKTLAKMLYKNKQAANICFSGLPLVKDSERRHVLITGTTGSGKTNMLNELLPQIRKERGRAIIVDLTGSFTDRFFDPKCDKILNPLKPKGEFSIRKWFTADKGWLFITSTPNQRVMLRPLIAAWISIAIKALMNRNINNTHSNMWFVIDELPALQKISSLGIALAESRKYGGCVVAGMQNIHQLEEIYGHAGAASMLDLFGSKFIFRVSDQQTAHKSALMLGEQEIIETQENLSYGANSMRDGVNMHSLEKRKLLVMPSEIMNLEDLTCYVKFAGNFPITKLQMNLQTMI
ncbi:type IV secretion system DNA-binding domain-containing protein [Rickettsia endosymbiont of Polydrusus tereticollis]|uniref:type IV secretion system DNA-binding domain-containing protein n=1 Tax=Rickettsia endosymbiont of Polydrusus tereticollis TaxID=3066251 RepID=UPI003132A360